MITEHTKRVAGARFWQFLGEDDPDGIDLAEDFHEASKFYRSTMTRSVRADKLLTNPQLRDSAAIGARELVHLPRVPLPEIDEQLRSGALRHLVRDPSCRSFSSRPVSTSDLGTLLWFSYGAYPERHPGSTYHRRPVASGGALYPLEIYVIARLDGADHKGLYHYNVHRHALSEVRDRVTPDDLRRLGEPPDLLASAPVIVLVGAMFWRSRFKYPLRGYRFTLLEAGAFSHQMSLVAQPAGVFRRILGECGGQVPGTERLAHPDVCGTPDRRAEVGRPCTRSFSPQSPSRARSVG